jgi:hypothetical protein
MYESGSTHQVIVIAAIFAIAGTPSSLRLGAEIGKHAVAAAAAHNTATCRLAIVLAQAGIRGARHTHADEAAKAAEC